MDDQQFIEQQPQPDLVPETYQLPEPEVVPEIVPEVVPEVVEPEVVPEVVEPEVVEPEVVPENILISINEEQASEIPVNVEMNSQYILPKEIMMTITPVAQVEDQQPTNPNLIPLFGRRSTRRNPKMRLYM